MTEAARPQPTGQPQTAMPLRESPAAFTGIAGAIIAVGFATAVGLWAVGYFTHLPIMPMPKVVTLVLLVLVHLAGGWALARGRIAGRDGRVRQPGLGAAIAAGLVTAVVNLMVLGAVVAESDQGPSPLLWLPGYFFVSMALLAIGCLLGRRFGGDGRQADSQPTNWPSVMAWTSVIATGLLVIAGGLVTGHDGGLAVPDWPTSFQVNMFLLPLSKMTGSAVYYEHAHRLFGSLVGLCTIVAAIMLWRLDRSRRPYLRTLLVVAVIAVIVQGVMGGYRVTLAHTGEDGVLIAGMEHETTSSTILRVVHGVFGQVFLALLAALAVLAGRSWTAAKRVAHPAASTDRAMGLIVIAALIIQLILGAVLRHVASMLFMHISFAAITLAVVLAAGVRAWGLYPRTPRLQKLGLWMIGTAMFQVAMGLAALVAISLPADEYLAANAMITTAHQAVGAGLLVLATIYALWVYRLVEPMPELAGQPNADAEAEASAIAATS